MSVSLHYPLVLGEAASGAVSGPTSGLGQGAGNRVNLPMVGQDSETVLMDPVGMYRLILTPCVLNILGEQDRKMILQEG